MDSEFIRGELIVGVEELDEAAGCVLEAGVTGDAGSGVLELDKVQLIAVLADAIDRGVGGAVIDDNNLGIWVRLGEAGVDSVGDKILGVKARDDDADHWKFACHETKLVRGRWAPQARF